jgi:hypothetical protein
LESADGASPDDRFTGVIESPVVVLGGPEISMRIGGGKGADVYAALCTLDGKEVVYARGENAQRMVERVWSVPDLVGKPVFFRVADRSTGGWGTSRWTSWVCRGRSTPKRRRNGFRRADAKSRKRPAA